MFAVGLNRVGRPPKVSVIPLCRIVSNQTGLDHVIVFLRVYTKENALFLKRIPLCITPKEFK